MLRVGKGWLVLAFSLLAVAACSSDEGKRAARDDAAAGGEGGDSLGGDRSTGGNGSGDASELGGVGGDGSGLGGVGGDGSGLGGVGGDAAGAEGQTATLFINDSANGVVYRYNVTPSSDPVLTATISAPVASSIAVSAGGELFVGEYTDAGDVLRFKSILATPTSHGMFSDANGHYLAGLTFVDDELWTMSSAYRACTADPASIVRYSFDADGVASATGTVTSGLIGANRGILWDPTNRMLFVTQCESFRAIQRYLVAADHSVTALAPVEGAPLDNPHQMVMTSWRELIVANAGTAAAPGMSLLRLKVDARGGLTPNGTIDGNGLNLPVGMAIAPWGELFVVSNATAVISRFTFDAAHVATAHGTFQMTAPTTAQSLGVGSVVFVPGGSTNLIGAGGAGG